MMNNSSIMKHIEQIDALASSAGISLNLNEILRQLQRPFNSPKCILVTGAANSGKSSFINVLLAECLHLPIQPHASGNTFVIAHTTEKPFFTLHTDNVRRELRMLPHVKNGATVCLNVNSPWLEANHLRLTEDCHGMESRETQGETAAAITYLLPYDMIVMIMSAQQSFSAPDTRFIKLCRSMDIPVLIVVSFMDTLDDDEVNELTQYVTKNADKLKVDKVYFMSEKTRDTIAAEIASQAKDASPNRVYRFYLMHCVDCCISAIDDKIHQEKMKKDQQEEQEANTQLSLMKTCQEWQDIQDSTRDAIRNAQVDANRFIEKKLTSFLRSSLASLCTCGNTGTFVQVLKGNLIPSLMEEMQERLERCIEDTSRKSIERINAFLRRFSLDSLSIAPNGMTPDAEASDFETKVHGTEKMGYAVWGAGSIAMLAVSFTGIGIALAPLVMLGSKCLTSKLTENDKKKVEIELKKYCNEAESGWKSAVHELSDKLERQICAAVQQRFEAWKTEADSRGQARSHENEYDYLLEVRQGFQNLKNEL